MKLQLVALTCAAFLSACGDSNFPAVARKAEPGAITLPDPETGACHASDLTPAVIETVTEQVILKPAETNSDGDIVSPAVYRTETRQDIVEDRRNLRFEALCESKINSAFITDLQRALTARSFYNGPINGEMNWRTQRAIRLYQIDQGIDSTILSKTTAQQLGLLAIDTDRRN